MPNESKTTYWLQAPDKDIVDLAFERIHRYYEFLASCAFAEKISKSIAYYAGGTIDDGHVSWKITRGGEQGEVLFSFENHYRSIAQSLLNLTTAQRPSVQARAKNSDKAAISRASVSNAVIEYHLTEGGLEELIRQMAEVAIVESEAFILPDWDHNAGEEVGSVDPTTGEAKQGKTGDPRFRLFHPFDVVRDPYATSYKALTWKIVRSFVNKFELAAQYPEVADKIVGLGPGDDDDERRIIFDFKPGESDLIAVWELLADDTPAVPGGRYVKFVKGIWLEGSPLPSKRAGLVRMAPAELLGTPFGYTPMFDLLGPQESINGIDTSILTNQLGRGIGNMLVPRAANVSIDQFATSMNAISYDGQQEPKPMEFPQTPREMFDYKKDKVAAMEVLSGMNSVVRGNPSENVGADASGSKLALLQATAIQQNSGIEREYVQAIRRLCLALIHLYRDRGAANMERTVKITGKNKKFQIKDFTAETFTDIDDVVVDIGNPLTRQISGRMAMADRLVELQLIKPENMTAYITLMQEGTLDPMIQGQQIQAARIEEENENLLEGKGEHVALITDPHWDEIPKHLEILDNPDLRQNTPDGEALRTRALDAVQQHIELFRQMTPDLVAMRGGQRALELWQLLMGGGGGQVSEGGQAGPPSPGAKPSMADQMAPESQAATPSQPQMPKNPATGERAPAAPGVTDQ